MKSLRASKVFRESFLAVSAFKEKKDTQALRHFVDPFLLCQWQEEWDGWNHRTDPGTVDALTIGRVWFADEAITIEFTGKKTSGSKTTDFVDHWTFKKSGERWFVSKVAPGREERAYLAA